MEEYQLSVFPFNFHNEQELEWFETKCVWLIEQSVVEQLSGWLMVVQPVCRAYALHAII